MLTNTIFKVFGRIIRHIMQPIRDLHLCFNRYRLKNHTFTIIANNCIGGIIYHDLKEQFRSPMINLWMKPSEFVILCEHLEYYMQIAMKEFPSNESYPVGVLCGEFGSLHVYFQHYKSFEEANAKWQERKSRINWDMIYVICEAPFESDETIKKLLALSYKKRIITHSRNTNSHKELVKIPYDFYFKDYKPGRIIGFPKFGACRYLEKINYVSFLNEKI